jgi:Uma2 family endonuclease
MTMTLDVLVPSRATNRKPKTVDETVDRTVSLVRSTRVEVTFARDPRGGRRLIDRPMTIEQWADMDEDEPGEFFDGYVVEDEVPDLSHERVVAWRVFTLMSWGKPRQALVFGSELKFAISEQRGRKPDVSMYAPGVRLERANLVRVPPMLMVEVLTPTPRDMRRDRIDKMAEYAYFGVRSYWIVDHDERSIECYELSKDGRVFLSATSADGQLEVPNFEGLILDLDDLWDEVDLVEVDPDDEPADP